MFTTFYHKLPVDNSTALLLHTARHWADASFAQIRAVYRKNLPQKFAFILHNSDDICLSLNASQK